MHKVIFGSILISLCAVLLFHDMLFHRCHDEDKCLDPELSTENIKNTPGSPIVRFLSVSQLGDQEEEMREMKDATSTFKIDGSIVSRKRTIAETVSRSRQAFEKQRETNQVKYSKQFPKKPIEAKKKHRIPSLRSRRSLVSEVCRNQGFSCKHACSFLRPSKVVHEAKLSCFCDRLCEFFEDCCADYDRYCVKTQSGDGSLDSFSIGSSVPLKVNDSSESAKSKRLWRCFNTSYPTVNRTEGIWMIGSCTESWPKDDVIYHKCHNLSAANTITKDSYRFLPVYHTRSFEVYHNKFCALCNRVPLRETLSYKLYLNCEISPPEHFSQEKKLEFLFAYCSKITWTPFDGAPRRYCLSFKSSCSNNNNLKLTNKCANGTTRLFNDRNCIYKNIDCARCNNQPRNEITCGPDASFLNDTCTKKESGSVDLPWKSLSIMFDFNSADGSHGTKMALKCTGGKVFDYHLSTCRKTFTVVPELSEFEKYEIMIWLQESSFAKYLWNISLVRFEIARNLDIEIEHLSDVSADVAAWTATIEFKIQIRHNETIPALGKFLEFVSPFNITIANHKFTIIKVTKRVLGCNNLHIFHRNEYTVSHDRKSVVHIKKTGEMFHLKDYYTNGTSANKSKAIFVCRRNWITECSGKWVSLENETIRILENKSIFVNNSKQTVYNQSEYVWQNGVILVCKDFPPPNSPSMKENDYALFILTSVSMFLSIIALLYFLVTYSIFAELRTLPGINLMNLSLSILLSQVLWLSGSGQTHSPVICATIAGLLHYLFLVSFVWTSIIAFDTWRAFRSSKGGRGLANSKKKKCLHCLRYMAVGWLSVMVYVVICVVLDLKNAVDIGYRSSQGCWISNPDKNLYFFGIPVSMILTLNFVFYVSTMRAIKATAEQAKLATNQSYNRQTLGVYIRIASAMGFTWIFGFIAPYGVYILWYPFVALNGLQGVYLALAFGLNQRVRNLYKNRYAWLNRETMDTDSLSMRRATTGLENMSCEDKDDTNI